MHQQQHYLICLKKISLQVKIYAIKARTNGMAYFKFCKKKLLYREIFKNTQATTTTAAKKKEMRCQFSHPVRTVLQPIHGVFDTHKTERRYV